MPLSHSVQTHNTEEIIEHFFIRVKNEKRAGLLPRDIL